MTGYVRFVFWPLVALARVKECAPELLSPRYDDQLAFADHSIWAHFYAVSLVSGEVVVAGGKQPIYVTGSLESFLALYVSNGPALFPQTGAAEKE